MKNPLRKICTAGSVRGEIALSHGRPIRARSWKRRIEAKERLPLRVVSSTRNLSNDFHYAFRGLRKSPGFAVTAILTLALGIGAVTAVFSVVNSVLLRPYPFREANQLVVWRETIQEVSDRYPVLPDNYKHYLNLRTRSKTIADAAIFQNASFAVAQGQDHPQIVNGLSVSSNFFAVLGTAPAIGRTFLPDEVRKGRNNVVVITWSAWQRFFNGS